MTSSDRQTDRVRHTSSRRAVLASLAAVSVAGCSSLRASESTPTETPARSWPDSARESNVTEADGEWHGTYRNARGGTSKFIADGLKIELAGSTATTRLGVYTGDEVDGNPEEIPEDEFDWYNAPRGSYFWKFTVNPMPESGDGNSSLPPLENWSAIPILNEHDEQATLPLAASYDPDPVYYRLPVLIDRGVSSYTSPAYGVPEMKWNARDTQSLVFEVPSSGIELRYGDPPENWWAYEVQ